MTRRARDLGIRPGSGRPGRWNAITDVPGVRVGQVTLVDGDGPLAVGQGPVRTGVTVVLPRDEPAWQEPVFAGLHALNGNGELTGATWLGESGLLMSPVAITSTHAVGVVRDALIAAETSARPAGFPFWRLPVVAETWDGVLHDINGGHLTADHVREALDIATGGAVAEGGVGGGTGMICHGFKGGTGTSSRVLEPEAGGYTVGVLVQANHGRRERLTIDGVPVGRAIGLDVVPEPEMPELPAGRSGGGSIVVVVATDAPLLPHQCRALAQRAGLGVARTGGAGENWSGDIFLAFATRNRGLPNGDYGSESPVEVPLTMVANAHLDPLYDAVIEATEEAIVNVLVAAQTMVGRDGIVAHGLDPDLLQSVLAQGRPTAAVPHPGQVP
ncbi:DmpA family aminopeptidase [Nocardioides sp. GXZ039]|uniref:DmpA family aminopeptidase n=1 Tax=Nocardioides sp. GXZ039 TaxID=3136018 RepID=UPI0030F49CAA